MQPAVDFPGTSRIHIALATQHLGPSKAFYEVLFGVPPTKVRPGYVKFEPAEPSVNLTLNEVLTPEAASRPVSHFGVQVRSTEAVQQAKARLEAAGLPTLVEESTSCCYAVQDKVWVSDPDGNRWEVFVVTQDDVHQPQAEANACCAPSAGTSEAGTSGAEMSGAGTPSAAASCASPAQPPAPEASSGCCAPAPDGSSCC